MTADRNWLGVATDGRRETASVVADKAGNARYRPGRNVGVVNREREAGRRVPRLAA